MDNPAQQQPASPLIYERLAAIMADVPAIGKNSQNQEQRYRFRGIDDVYNYLHPLFVRYQVFTTSEILNKNREVWTNKNGTIMIEYSLQVQYRFTAIDGSFVETQAMGQAMDSSDKASNKAMSMAHKAAMLQIFMIPTLDIEDADATSPEPQAHATSQQPAPQYTQQHSQQAPPTHYEPKPAAQAQNNGYAAQQKAPAATQQNGYTRHGGGQQNDRPPTDKSITFLRDLTGRPKVSREDAARIEAMISSGSLTSTQCSGLIETLRAYLNGQIAAVFQPSSREEQPYYEEQPAQYQTDDMPF